MKTLNFSFTSLNTRSLKPVLHMMLTAFVAGLISSQALAEKMNPETQDLVISKMERVLISLDSSDSSWVASNQRLADLLAERARYRFMLEIEANCDGCKGSKADRQKAVDIYESLLKTVELKNDGLVLFQLAHLYQMAGKIDKAQGLFEGVLKSAKKKKISQSILTRTHSGLGDLLFQKGKFKEAHAQYLLALSDPALENRSLVVYNKAWCEFNNDQLDRAIKTLSTLLADPSKITRDKEEGKVYDGAFHTDALKDLATFHSRRTVTENDINGFEGILPKEQKKMLLLHFATEVDRIGQKKAAQSILNRYLKDPTLTEEEKLHAYVMKAQVSYDGGQAAQSTQDFAKAAKAFQDEGCDEVQKCQELQKTMKRYVTELHRSKKLSPDQDLVNAYGIYAKTFPQDKEMHARGSQVALDISQYALAIQFYRNISKGDFSDKEKEEALLSEVSAAEKSENAAIKKDSYLFFIKNSENKEKVFEVRYQLAYLAYQQKQFKEAADSFYELALEKKGRADLRKKAADLSLDAQAVLKNDAELEAWAWKYSAVFPQYSKEFDTLARKALMNQVALVANNPKSTNSDLKKYLEKTWEAKLSNATNEEKILFYNNASVLSLKVEDFEKYIKAQNLLLNQAGVQKAQKQEIYASLASFYEKRLDFKQAYNWSKKIENSKVSKKEREFRLGTLADLGGINPSSHYKAALQSGLTDARSLVIRSRLVSLSSNPVAELKRQAPELKRQPQLLNDMVLLVYAKTGNKKALLSLVESKALRSRSAARFLNSQSIYEKIQQHNRKISQSRFASYSPNSLQKGTLARVKLLAQTDALLKESLKLQDITAQMMVLDIISNENLRLSKELASIPEPKGLTPAQLNQYHQILNSKLRPFQAKAQMAEQKKQEIWTSSRQLVQMINDYTQARPEVQKLMNSQMKLLSEVSGDGPLKFNLKNAMSSSSVSIKDLASARQSVSENPNDKREIENLKNLETKIGHPLMPAYLEARLNHLQKGKNL